MMIYFWGWRDTRGNYLPCDKTGSIVGIVEESTGAWRWIEDQRNLVLEFSEEAVKAQVAPHASGSWKIISLEIDDAL